MAKKTNWLLWGGLAAGVWWLLKGRTQAAPTPGVNITKSSTFTFDPLTDTETYRQYFARHGVTTTGLNGNYDAVASAGKLDTRVNTWSGVYLWTDQL